MKKKYFRSWFAAAVALLFFATCSKDGDADVEEEDVYVPPAGMAQDEIASLLLEASTARQASVSFALVEVSSATREDGSVSAEKRVFERNSSARRQSDCSYTTENSAGWEAPDRFTLIDGFKQYTYISASPERGETRMWENITDAYWNVPRGDDPEETAEEIGKYSWRVEGNAFKGDFTYMNMEYENESHTATATVTLTADKRLRTWTEEVSYHAFANRKTRFESTCSYAASPGFPPGFDAAGFIERPQYRLTVVWGNGKGENVFYAPVENCSGYDADCIDGAILYLSDVEEFAPAMEGKKPKFYLDDEFAEPMKGQVIIMYHDDTRLYVEWVSSTSGKL
ncbi:MAG: hypothetical protein LBR08_02255 [Bacteroidales bacterium]|nr:hypothetical protein [Bacteroidales bacterium]